MADGSNKFKNSINLNPQSSDPTNPVEGDIFYSDGTPRTEGTYIYKNGAWEEVQVGAVSPSFTLVTKTGTSETLSASGEDIVLANPSAGDQTLTLPAASGNSGLRYRIINIQDTYNIIVDGNGAETINGSITYYLTRNTEAVTIVCNGTAWYIESEKKVPLVIEAHSNDGEGVTADTEDIPFKTTVTDTHSAWDNSGNTGNNTSDAFTVPVGKDGTYTISGMTRYTAATAGSIKLYVDGIFVKRISMNVSDNMKLFSVTHEFSAGEIVTLRVDSGVTLNSVQNNHYIRIQEIV